MLPVIIGAGAVALLLKVLIEDEEEINKEIKKRIFMSFAIEDEQYRDFFWHKQRMSVYLSLLLICR